MLTLVLALVFKQIHNLDLFSVATIVIILLSSNTSSNEVSEPISPAGRREAAANRHGLDTIIVRLLTL
jgi:hypothetical protein